MVINLQTQHTMHIDMGGGSYVQLYGGCINGVNMTLVPPRKGELIEMESGVVRRVREIATKYYDHGKIEINVVTEDPD